MRKEQTNILIKALLERPGLAANKLCPKYPTLIALKKGWDSIAQELNSSDGSKHHKYTAFGARKKFADLKYTVRKKASALEKMKKEGITKIPPSMKLSQLEKKVLVLAPLKKSSGVSTPSTSSQNEDDPTCQITDDRTDQESPDNNESALDCSVDVPADRVDSNNDTTRNTSRLREQGNFRELFSLQRSKLDIRKEELLIKKEKLELKKQEIELMKKQLTVQTKTLSELKTISKLMEKTA